MDCLQNFACNAISMLFNNSSLSVPKSILIQFAKKLQSFVIEYIHIDREGLRKNEII